MARSAVLHPDGSDYDGFLYAFVGADRNGSMVTVLSTLARLGLDPWKEASELTGLSKGAALTRLGVLLKKSSDVPTLTDDHETVARELISLLPVGTGRRVPLQSGTSESGVPLGAVVTISAIAVVLVVLTQSFFPDVFGLGSLASVFTR